MQHSIARSSLSSLALTLSTGIACSTQPMHDIGSTEGELAAPEVPVAASVSDFAGAWIGAAEDPLANSDEPYKFPSGSTRILLEITEDGEASSYLTFGDGMPPAPATDPDVGYPEVDPNFTMLGRANFDDSVLPPTEAFRYEAGRLYPRREFTATGLPESEMQAFHESGRVLDGRLDLTYFPTHVFSSWCELQTVDTCTYTEQFGWDDGRTDCTFGADFIPIDCQKASLCGSRVCECPEAGSCTASSVDVSLLTLRLSEDGLVGLFSNAVFLNERGFQQAIGTVRFHRSDP